MSQPPIQDLDNVDIAAKRNAGGVDLFIVASGPLDASPQTRRLLLAKVRSYLEQLNTDAFRADFDHPPPEKVRMVVSCEDAVDRAIVELIERCRPWVQENNARIELEGA
jgi:hypothetical protein